MERLLQMQKEIYLQQAKAAYSEALAQCQLELPVIPKNGKILNRSKEVQSRFARWEDINERIKPILSRHGFSLSFRSLPSESGVIVHAVLTHRDGHSEESVVPAPADASGNKNSVQAIGSSLSYCKRYAASLLLNITTAGEDDDGNGGPDPEAVTLSEAKEVFLKWKQLDPNGGRAEFEEWVDATCGVKRPNDPAAWRRRDLELCHGRLKNMEETRNAE